MASLVFPVEIWLDILPRACQDDGTAGLSLSSASQGLRFISRPYRYQSVQIKGWRQLLLFKEHFSRVPEDERRIVNLYVDLEHVLEAGYPSAPVWAPEDSDPDDGSYVPSDDEAELDEVDGLEGSCGEDGDTESRARDMEDELEFAPLSMAEQLEIEEDLNPLCRGRSTGSLFPGRDIGILVDLQREVNLQSRQAEGYGYATLHRLLKMCASSLEIFTLCWAPATLFMGEELFPTMPRLRSLTVWVTRTESKSGPLPIMDPPRRFGDRKNRISRGLARFPSLRRLEFSRPFDCVWFQEMPIADLELEYVSTFCSDDFSPEYYYRSFPQTTIHVRIHCDCQTEECSRNPGFESFQVDPIDFKQEWVDQVCRCCVTPGPQSGYIPVVLAS